MFVGQAEKAVDFMMDTLVSATSIALSNWTSWKIKSVYNCFGLWKSLNLEHSILFRGGQLVGTILNDVAKVYDAFNIDISKFKDTIYML